MKSCLRLLAIILLFFLTLIPILNPASAKDIKDEVIKRTILDEQIAAFCLRNCLGNEKKGYLKSFTVEPIDKSLYKVNGKAAMQNRHVVSKYVVYDHTVVVNTLGTLNPDSCELRIDDVSIENDYGGIFTAMLQNYGNVIGKTETIPDCKSFLE